MTSFQGCMSAAAVAVLVLATSGHSLAQGKGKGKGKPAASASAAAEAPSGADAAKLEEAKKHMVAGAALYNDPSGQHKCEEAYVEFDKAYELSGSLNALRSRAVCALELEKDGEALADYKKVLAGIGDKLAPDVKAQIESDVKTLDASTAWVTIKLDIPSAKLVDVRTPSRGLPVKNRYDSVASGTKLGIHPGDHVFTASTPDGKEVTWKVTLENGTTHEHTFELNVVTTPSATPTVTAPPTSEVTAEPTATASDAGLSRPTPTSVKVLLGVTGALAIGTGVMMGLASVQKSDYDKGCTFVNGQCFDNGSVADLKAQRAQVVMFNGIADGLLGGTVLAAGATLVLYLIRPSVKAEETKKTGYYFAPAVTPSSGGLVAGGRF